MKFLLSTRKKTFYWQGETFCAKEVSIYKSLSKSIFTARVKSLQNFVTPKVCFKKWVTAKSGTDVMILENIFAKNFSEKNWRF
jgi:hypothetical protein